MRLLVRIVKHVKPFAKMPVKVDVKHVKADVNQAAMLVNHATQVIS